MLSKSLFALLSDPATNSGLDERERAAVDAYVPWTRVLVDGPATDWTGRRVDLVEFAMAHRDELVVKPATDYGGAGVVLGWTTEPDWWEASLRRALESPSVLQRRIAVPSELFPRMVDGALELQPFYADVDPYAFAGETGLGAGTRLSPSQLLNVSAGGGSAAPVFVIEPR
jgi:hypothetical protein